MASILVVEDDPQIRSMLVETLSLEGYRTDSAENGVEALSRFREQAPDLVITDIIMPEKEGLSLIKELHAMNPKVKVIAISGGAPRLSPECNLELARMFGAVKTFAKPLDIDAMLRAIQEELKESAG
jgi:CheY-like chemotaxis protein